MTSTAYEQRRQEIETYFDRTAADTWDRLTSDAPVSRIRQTVREGRELMRDTLLSWLPQDLEGRRILDAGCGTGVLAQCLAARGAEVVAVDLSPTLVSLARKRAEESGVSNIPRYVVGDMRELELGHFDHVVAMDSLIHYGPTDGLETLTRLAGSIGESMVFTFAPRTPLLAMMHAIGQLFPRGDRSPAIVPVAEDRLRNTIEAAPGLSDWRVGRTARVNSGFYISQGLEVRRR